MLLQSGFHFIEVQKLIVSERNSKIKYLIMKVNTMKKIKTAIQLKKTRLKLNMSQAVFSDRLGISIRQLSRIETGESNITKTLAILASYIYQEEREMQ